MKNKDDATLINSCVENHHGAWEEFCVRFNPLFKSIITKILFNFGGDVRHHTEDVLQYAYVEMLEDRCRRLRAYKGKAKLSTYLSSVVHNLCIDYLRKNSFITKEEPLPLNYEPSEEPKILSAINEKEELEMIDKAVDELPAKAKIIVKLFYSGRKIAEISKILEIPVGTVESTLHRSVNKIKAIVFKRLDKE